jgi:hypothetical protein
MKKLLFKSRHFGGELSAIEFKSLLKMSRGTCLNKLVNLRTQAVDATIQLAPKMLTVPRRMTATGAVIVEGKLITSSLPMSAEAD